MGFLRFMVGRLWEEFAFLPMVFGGAAFVATAFALACLPYAALYWLGALLFSS